MGLDPSRDLTQRLVEWLESDVLVSDDPETAFALYANTGPRTLSRDLNRLSTAGLIVREGRTWKANTAVMFAFMLPTDTTLNAR